MTLLIFDFDGVVADSELIANRALAAALTEAGLPTSMEQSLERFMGRRWADCEADIEVALGGPIPEDFHPRRRAVVRAEVEASLTEVRGLTAFLDAHDEWPRCIASSSTHEWLDLALARIGLTDRFAHRFSGASDVARGKPFPDLFLHAAHMIGHAAGDCVVIEDSVPGVAAARAAGMFVIGLTAGAHCRAGHGDVLRAAGADAVVESYADVAALIAAAGHRSGRTEREHSRQRTPDRGQPT